MSTARRRQPCEREDPGADVGEVRSVVLRLSPDATVAWTNHVDDLLAAGWDGVVVPAVAPDWKLWGALGRLVSREGVGVAVSTSRRDAVAAGFEAASGDVAAARRRGSPARLPAGRRPRDRPRGRDRRTGRGRLAGPECRPGLPRPGTSPGVPVSTLRPAAVAFTRDAWTEIADRVEEGRTAGVAFETELVARATRTGCSFEDVTIEAHDPNRPAGRPARTAGRPRFLRREPASPTTAGTTTWPTGSPSGSPSRPTASWCTRTPRSGLPRRPGSGRVRGRRFPGRRFPRVSSSPRWRGAGSSDRRRRAVGGSGRLDP